MCEVPWKRRLFSKEDAIGEARGWLNTRYEETSRPPSTKGSNGCFRLSRVSPRDNDQLLRTRTPIPLKAAASHIRWRISAPSTSARASTT